MAQHKLLTSREDTIQYAQQPQWSADGERVIIYAQGLTRRISPTLFTVNVADGHITPIDQDHPDGAHYIENLQGSAVTAPDGRYEAVLDVSADERTVALFLLDDNTQRRLYTLSGLLEYQRSVFSWSPDSRLIALVAVTQDKAELLVLDVETGDSRVLAQGADAVSIPAWQP